jgi:hypothetical protein
VRRFRRLIAWTAILVLTWFRAAFIRTVILISTLLVTTLARALPLRRALSELFAFVLIKVPISITHDLLLRPSLAVWKSAIEVPRFDT